MNIGRPLIELIGFKYENIKHSYYVFFCYFLILTAKSSLSSLLPNECNNFKALYHYIFQIPQTLNLFLVKAIYQKLYS